MGKARLVLLGGAFLVAVAVFWPAPADRNPRRPSAGLATALPQEDVVVDGLRLRVVVVGPTEADPLLLIPGHTARIEVYERIVPLLAEVFRVHVFDFPGSGYSDKPERRYDLQFYEDIVLGYLDMRG